MDVLIIFRQTSQLQLGIGKIPFLKKQSNQNSSDLAFSKNGYPIYLLFVIGDSIYYLRFNYSKVLPNSNHVLESKYV